MKENEHRNINLYHHYTAMDSMKSKLNGMVTQLGDKISQAQTSAPNKSHDIINKITQLERDRDLLHTEIKQLKDIVNIPQPSIANHSIKKSNIPPPNNKKEKAVKTDSKDKISLLQNEITKITQKYNKKCVKTQQLRDTLQEFKKQYQSQIEHLQIKNSELQKEAEKHMHNSNQYREQIEELLSKQDKESQLYISEINNKNKLIEELKQKNNSVQSNVTHSKKIDANNVKVLSKLQNIVKTLNTVSTLSLDSNIISKQNTIDDCLECIESSLYTLKVDSNTCLTSRRDSPKQDERLINIESTYNAEPCKMMTERCNLSSKHCYHSEFDKVSLELTSRVKLLEDELRNFDTLDVHRNKNHAGKVQTGRLHKNNGKKNV